MELIWWNWYSGHPSIALPSMRRALGQYLRQASNFKIGLTNDPERRWYERYQYDWDQMIVIYRTTSWRYVAEIEDALIQYGWDRYLDRSWNQYSGGGGVREGFSEYWVYIVREFR